MNKMFLSHIIIIILIIINLIQSYPYFPECNNTLVDSNTTILSTLYGKIKGACYNVPVNYASKQIKSNQVMTWLSIPYAEQPVVKLRYKNPVQKKSWTNVLDGTRWPNKCLQEYGSSPIENSEDCLYLNLFVPYEVYINRTNNKAPILLWIHGGKFTVGSTYEDELEPSTLVSMSNIIVVTINYRLGIYGFLHINNTDAKGNQAILDQQLAMKWVHDNADLFGGDKYKITLAGQSAGSWAVGYHLMHRPSWPYFRNAILQSGNPLEESSRKLLTSEQATKIAFNVSKLISGCNNIVNNHELFDCLQNAKINETKYASSLYWYYPPVVSDSTEFNLDPEIMFKTGNFKRCNLLLGANSKDRGYFVKTKMKNADTYLLSNITSDLIGYFKQSAYRYKPNISTVNELAKKILQMYKNEKYIDYLDLFIKITTDERYKCPGKFKIHINYYSKTLEFNGRTNFFLQIFMIRVKIPKEPRNPLNLFG